mgnify:CR=1 FL=1
MGDTLVSIEHPYISKEVEEDIQKKLLILEKLNCSKRFLSCHKLTRKVIAERSQIQSYRIEHPNEGVPFSVPRNKKKMEIKNGIKDIMNAFTWGKNNFDPNNFRESFVREIAGRITPNAYIEDTASYRESGVRITGSNVTPPYPEKLVRYEIPWFEKSMNELLRRESGTGIEPAIFAHFHVARMHPFVDGNGRTSRTLQDVILDHCNIPLPVIQAAERMFYYKLLDQAIYSWKNRGGRDSDGILSKEERLFYDFMAGKINISLDKILRTCQN